jgi:hypothetical protein
VRVHLAAEHALEFEPAYGALQLAPFLLQVAGGALIPFRFGQLKQLRGIRDALLGARDLADVGTQARTFAPELLGARRV